MIYFIAGTAKLHTDDIVNKSVVFRITETSCHIIHVSKNGENFSNKVSESDWKGDFHVSREKHLRVIYQVVSVFAEETESSIRSPMSVEIQVAYYITVEGPIGKLQILLVFLEHQFRL